MPDEQGNFQTKGPTWQERSENFDDVRAVYAPNDIKKSRWLALLYDKCVRVAIRQLKSDSIVLDFGCGIGHQTLTLAEHTKAAIGVDITFGMLQRARNKSYESSVSWWQIDGIHLPIQTGSLDLIWVCAVLRYSLLVAQPKHREIVDEFKRVLKPGGLVCNLEMYVDQPSSLFAKDFLDAGFHLKSLSIVRENGSIFDRLAAGRWHRLFLRPWWSALSTFWTSHTANEDQLDSRIRDYFFVYQKPS